MINQLKELGFEQASNRIETERNRMKKMHIAYQNFEFVSPESINKFNEKLREKTKKEDKYRTTYDKLVFIPVKDYNEAPPKEVLEIMKTAVEKKCFGVASGTQSTMRSCGMVLSMGIVMILFSIYVGKAQITIEYYSAFLTSVKVGFLIFTALCFGGIFAQLTGRKSSSSVAKNLGGN